MDMRQKIAHPQYCVWCGEIISGSVADFSKHYKLCGDDTEIRKSDEIVLAYNVDNEGGNT